MLLSDQSIATVQRHADTWNWRNLTAGSTIKGTRVELEAWLEQATGHSAS